MAQNTSSQEFTAFYLQRTTQEFAEDLDKVREADDFKAESVPFLVHALQQGTALYPAADQTRVMRPAPPTASTSAAAEEDDDDVDMDEPRQEKEFRSRKKEKSKRKKSSG